MATVLVDTVRLPAASTERTCRRQAGRRASARRTRAPGLSVAVRVPEPSGSDR
jgi:hypothetical protein